MTLTLYGRDYCELCEAMYAAVLPLAAQHGCTVEWVDVADDPALEARFGTEIPVLLAGERVLCRHALDLEALTRYFGPG
ncbi:MAG TPA: glutaredoxin family protein [Gammaproteobacteria bacterium]